MKNDEIIVTYSERQLVSETTDTVISEIVKSVKDAIRNGSWNAGSMDECENDTEKIIRAVMQTVEIPKWYQESVYAIGKIIALRPQDGTECALLLLESTKKAGEASQRISAQRMLLDSVTAFCALPDNMPFLNA